MIIYRPGQPPLLSDYGIEVPLLQGRAEKIYRELIKKFGNKYICNFKEEKLVDADFERVHSKAFLEKCKMNPEKVIEETFELINPDGSYHRYNPKLAKKGLRELVESYRESCDYSYLALKMAGQFGFSYYLGGGFHHSLKDRGRGFCLFNDILIACKKYQKDIKQGVIWVIDLDAHKGCGTASISYKDSSIKTLSIHMKDGWPLDQSEFDKNGIRFPWYTPSTIDIGIASGEEEKYLEKLKAGLEELKRTSPDHPVLAVVVDGSDPYEEDALPSASLLKLSKEKCLDRNQMVYKFLKVLDIPQAYLLSGGYGDKNWIIHYQFIESVLKP